MRQVRIGTFETNSSSTHTLVIVSKEEYEKFKKGELLFNKESYELTSKKDVGKILVEQRRKWDKNFKGTAEEMEELIDEETESYDDFGENYETFEREYKTKSGDEVVAFGYYGYDN